MRLIPVLEGENQSVKSKLIIRFCLLSILMLGLAGCTPPRPNNIENICSVFYQYPSWYWEAKKSAERWGVPIAVQMAIIYQESRFSASAKPPREHLLWVIPWFRPTSAYGYSQALKDTWERFERDTGEHGKRSDFATVTQFIGWYGYLAHTQAGVPRNNAYAVYLAYHEGVDGYRHHTYWHKSWLIHVAHKVAYRAYVYQQQLVQCQNHIKKPHWWNFL